ncbi:MAG: nicotinamide riboside transporter PnuC [Desulfovibrio sp.]|nr:MAG: nicotinamide riboside transporter PnuC [Desulfovibrio sp.]
MDASLVNFVVEIVAALFGAVCVWLTLKENIWCWGAGLVQVSLYVWVFWQAKLYSDMGLHVVYVFLQFYGFYAWMWGGEGRTRLLIRTLSPREIAFWAGLAALGTAVLGGLMRMHTDAALPFWDAATTVLSLIAQWLMARKVLESWLVWISVDVLCVGIYTVKGLYPTAVLYGLFLILASMGYMAWRTTFLKKQAA